MTKSNAVEIAGIDVSAKRMGTLLEETYQNNINKITILLRIDVNDLVTLSKFQTITVWEATSGTLKVNANRIFTGEISKIERTPGVITVTAFSDLWQAVQTEVNQIFDKNVGSEAGEGSEIFISLAGLANLTADSTSVVATGTGAADIVLDQFVCTKTDVFERMQTLADIYKRQFYEDVPNQKIKFEPLGFVTNSNTIFIGGTSNNVQSFTKWKDDNTSFFNKVEIIGAFQEQRTTEKFDGDGSTTQFTLTFEPEIVEIIVDGVLQTGGVTGSTETFDYSVDKKNKQINFESGSIPAVGVGNIVVDYSYRTPRPVVRTNDSSVTEIGRVIKKRFTFTDIETVDDAERRGQNLLAIFSEAFRSTKLTITPATAETLGISIGEAIRVIDDRQKFDEMMIIKKMRTSFPENDIEIELGDREFRVASYEYDTTLRIKRLEEEQAKAGTFVTEIIDPTHDINVKVRYVENQTQDIRDVGNEFSFVLGHPDGGVLGTNQLGDRRQAAVTVFVQQSSNIYNENFNDTDFKDTGNTTATWTGTGSVTFTADQVARSTSIDLDNGTITQATMTPTIVSGTTFTLELSANGGTNFETVTSGVRHFFTNTGTDLIWRATIGKGTGEISNILINDYH